VLLDPAGKVFREGKPEPPVCDGVIALLIESVDLAVVFFSSDFS